MDGTDGKGEGRLSLLFDRAGACGQCIHYYQLCATHTSICNQVCGGEGGGGALNP